MLWHNAGLEDGACCPCGGKKRMARMAAAEAAAAGKEGKEGKERKFKPRAMERFCKHVFVPKVHGTATGRVAVLVSTVAWLGMLIGCFIPFIHCRCRILHVCTPITHVYIHHIHTLTHLIHTLTHL